MNLPIEPKDLSLSEQRDKLEKLISSSGSYINKDSLNLFNLPTSKLEAWKYFPIDYLHYLINSITEYEKQKDIYEIIKVFPRGANLISDEKQKKNALEIFANNFTRNNENAIFNLNEAIENDFHLIHICENLDLPLELRFSSSSHSSLSLIKIIILVDKGCSATIIENREGISDRSLYSSILQIQIEDNANVRHYQVDRSYQVKLNTTEIIQKQSSYYNFLALDFNYPSECDIDKMQKLTQARSINRRQMYIKLVSPNAKSEIGSISLGHGYNFLVNGNTKNNTNNSFTKHYIDNYVTIHHCEQDCESHQKFNGIWSDNSQGVFYGRILVDSIAQKTEAFQKSDQLILGDATLEVRPELTIFADDVKCSHGATLGSIDKQAVFYLISRGMNPKIAELMVAEAFVIKILDNNVEQNEDKAVNEYIAKLKSELKKIISDAFFTKTIDKDS